ncbi:hypothetical protein IAT38_006870 [Cryptococcus sp. DSM 104549]
MDLFTSLAQHCQPQYFEGYLLYLLTDLQNGRLKYTPFTFAGGHLPDCTLVKQENAMTVPAVCYGTHNHVEMFYSRGHIMDAADEMGRTLRAVHVVASFLSQRSATQKGWSWNWYMKRRCWYRGWQGAYM